MNVYLSGTTQLIYQSFLSWYWCGLGYHPGCWIVIKTFDYLGLNWEKYVEYDSKYERPAEVDLLIGDYSKAKEKLGWEPKTSFDELVKLMVDSDMKLAEREKTCKFLK